MERRGEMSESITTNYGASSARARIVNGLTYRPREKVNVWAVLGCLFLNFPGMEIVVALAAVPFGVRRILKYLDARGWLVRQQDDPR
jgi:hypothetical protein